MSTELWRQCSQWLASLGAIDPRDRVLHSSAKISDLVSLLRDGVVLCQLVHSLEPEALDVSRVLRGSPASDTDRACDDFLCRNNLFLFLHACVQSFHLSMENHWFQPEDLYLCRDIGRVLGTLSALSHSTKVIKRSGGVAGFPRKGDKALAKRLKVERKDYEALNRLYGEAETEYIYDSFSRKVADAGANIYEDIYQTIFPPRQPRLSLDSISFGSKKSKRQAPLNELVDTEDKYLENLIMVRDCFRQPLSGLVAAPHRSVVFCLWDDLVALHTDLLFELKARKCADVGGVFLRAAPSLSRLYATYCVNLPLAMDLLERLAAENPALRRALLDCQAKARPPTFPLSSHLVIPFQRFLKYHLLLKEILKHTAADAADRASLGRAVDAMMAAANDVNEKKREHEESERQAAADAADRRLIDNVAATIKCMQLPNGAVLADFGRLRKAGDATAYVDYGKVADYAFLFDMVLVLCHKPKWLQHRYRFRQAVRVKDYFLEPIPDLDAPPGSGAEDADDAAAVFSVRLYRRSDARSPPVTLILKTRPDRDVWFHALLSAMDAVNPVENSAQRHVLQMTTFPLPAADEAGSAAAECHACGRVLRGSFFQGYRCLRCQASLHKACIADYACLEVGNMKRADSVTLPVPLPDSLERSNSTLSLASASAAAAAAAAGSRMTWQVQEMQTSLEKELEALPLEQQPWYAGSLAAAVATERLEALPVGTFLVRRRNNGLYALMLKTAEAPKGVKAMAVQVRHDEAGRQQFFFSGAKSFASIQKLVAWHRTRDLTDNFDYPALKGVCLKLPYKSV